MLFWHDSATAGAQKSKIIKQQKCCFFIIISHKWKHCEHSQNWISYYKWHTVRRQAHTWMYVYTHTHTHRVRTKNAAENKAYLGFNLFYGKCWWYINLISFHVSGIFFTQNIHIIFYFDSINILLQNYKINIILSDDTFLINKHAKRR
jgi:hypothetical protein